jgi:hypothetical protein
MNAEKQEMAAEEERVSNPFAAPVVAAPTGASAQALVQREVAEVQAMCVVAKRFPRDQSAAMDRIITACTRETLAESALYSYARGGTDITGPSIRLAEEMARSWGNIVCGVTELSRATGYSECLAYAYDLETNFRDEKRFTVRHWRDTKKGGHPITEERDIYEVTANMGARRKRACILAVIPGDVTEAAVRQCQTTLTTKVKLTPERLANMLDGFAEFSVTKEQIEKRIQRRYDTITPALFVNLFKIWNSLKDNMSKPTDWFEPEAQPEGEAQTATAAVHAKLRERQQKKAAPATQPAATTQPAAEAKGERIPQYDKDTAVAALRATANLKELAALYIVIVDDFGATKRELPIDVEAVYNDRRLAFEQAEEAKG